MNEEVIYFPIVCYGLDAHRLKQLLEENISVKDNIQLTIKEDDDMVRSLSPELIVGLIGPGIGAFVTLLIQSLQKIYEKKLEKNNAMVKLTGSNGTHIEFPFDTPEEKILKLISYVNKLDKIEEVSIT